MKKIIKLMVAFAILACSAHAMAGIRDKGTELYNSTRAWYVFGYNASGVYYFDPFSLVNNGTKWDINITYVNSQGLYDPELTQTLTMDCSNRKIQFSGWRINGTMQAYKGPLGIWVMNPTKNTVQNGTIGSDINDWLCGQYVNGSRYYGVVGSVDVIGQNASFNTWWVKENEVAISTDNNDLRMMQVLNYVKSTHMNYTSTLYVKCRESSIMQADAGRALSAWVNISEPTAPWMILINRACSGNNTQMRITTQKFEPPAPLQPAAATQPSPDTGNISPIDSIEAAKRKCADLGFLAGTPKFGQCVLRLSR